MNTVTAVTFDRLRWWIVAAALGAAIISAASIATDVTATISVPADAVRTDH
jgi:hypothetical protein